jgi:hypothetical protein
MTLIGAMSMHLFKRSSNAKEKWHKKALFVNLSKTRIVLVVATEPKSELPLKEKTLMKPKHAQSWTPTVGPYSAMEELLKQEQYGLLGFISCR